MTRPALRRLLTLETPVRTSDAGGGASVRWEGIGAVWADVQAVSAQEGNHELRTRSVVTHRVIVRAAVIGSPARPKPDQRFREGVRIYGIRAVAEHDPAGRYLMCWVEEGDRS